MRTGFGFDSHLFSRSGTLVLGGRKFPGVPALKGHSDGDALLHALIDALLGAATAGDIGRLFSDKNPSLKGISSRVMLRQVLAVIQKKGFTPVHVDLTVLADRPRMSEVGDEIRRILSGLLKLRVTEVSLKAKTPEGLNFFKKPGGIAVWAVTTLQKSKS
jgi:2-C-methyl-D-erythritol 2,4-cyclodiphosphate synthase